VRIPFECGGPAVKAKAIVLFQSPPLSKAGLSFPHSKSGGLAGSSISEMTFRRFACSMPGNL
jgi:hypothetical protein